MLSTLTQRMLFYYKSFQASNKHGLTVLSTKAKPFLEPRCTNGSNLCFNSFHPGNSLSSKTTDTCQVYCTVYLFTMTTTSWSVQLIVVPCPAITQDNFFGDFNNIMSESFAMVVTHSITAPHKHKLYVAWIHCFQKIVLCQSASVLN